jgi:hypothetical protein
MTAAHDRPPTTQLQYTGGESAAARALTNVMRLYVMHPFGCIHMGRT